MYEDLEILIEGRVSPERMSVILEAAECLDNIGFHNHHTEIQELALNVEYEDPLNIVPSVEAILLSGINRVLNSFSVFTESTDLSRLTAMINALVLLPEYDDVDTILAICEADEDAETRFSDLVELVSEFDSSDILLDLKSVNPRLLDRLINVVTNRENEIRDDKDIAPIAERMRKCLSDRTYIISEAIETGLPLGLDHNLLYHRFVDQLERLTPGRAGEELAAILMSSSLSVDEVLSTAEKYLGELFQEPSQVMESVAAVRTFLREYGKK